MEATVFSSIFDRDGRISRHGEFTIITFQGGAVVAATGEFNNVQAWARTQLSYGSGNRDLMFFLGRFQTLLARSGSGIATRGSRTALSGIVKAMKAFGLPMDSWSVPANLEDSMEVAKPKPDA